MSRNKAKTNNAFPLPQFKYLRFADVSAIEGAPELDEVERSKTNVLLNLGGYTLAFRILDLSKQSAEVQAEWEDAGTYLLQYAWAECCFDDNFDRKIGRQVASARLKNLAPDWTYTTPLELEGEVREDQIIQRHIEIGEIDLKGHEHGIAKCLIHSFIQEQQSMLFNGSDLDSYMDYLVDYNGRYVIDSTVLLTGDAAEDDEDVAAESAQTAEDGKTALHALAALLAPEVRSAYNIPQNIIDQMMCHLADTSAAFDQIIAINSVDDDDSDEDDDADESDLTEYDSEDESDDGDEEGPAEDGDDDQAQPVTDGSEAEAERSN